MPRRSALQVVVVVVIVAALVGVAAELQHLREQRYPPPSDTEESLYVTSGTALKHLAAGYTALAADLYWIRAIQYYGGVKLRLANAPGATRTPVAHVDYKLLYPMLDLTTTLDPQFNIAYRFGSIFLAESYPGGAGRPDLAIALLQKGLSQQPDKWEYMQDIGFVNYWWKHDYKAAADWFARAGDVPGAPWWLRSLAATTLAEGGDRQSSRVMWEAIRESAEIDWLKHDAEHRLMQLNALDLIDRLQQVVDRYAQASGQRPSTWTPLIRARILSGVPADPTGAPFEIDAGGVVRLSKASALYPLPDEPRRLVAPAS